MMRKARSCAYSVLLQRLVLCGACMLSGLLALGEAHGFTIHYSDSRSLAIRNCDDHIYRGNDELGDECYTRLLNTSEGLEQADAAAALGDIRQANRLYRELAANSSNPSIKTHWGLLYLQTHQVSDAEALFREALLYDESWLPARLGLAKSLAEGFEGRARELLESILEEHPDSLQALLMLARIELELQNLDTARELLERASVQSEAQGYPPLEIYALQAGANLLEDRPMTEWVDLALAYNCLLYTSPSPRD